MDEMRVNFKFLKFIRDGIFILFAVFNNVTALLEQYIGMHFSWYFQQKSVLSWLLEV